ncbi:MAG: ATP-binding cassette domain-containing protein [Lachnospiraceae bacterium]|nr:ATP-binding cassette domain-containing protein [Lachnospiraceae bacterium]
MSIIVENLVKKYGEKTAVDNVSFRIEKGTPFAILGRNGSGKSTTIKTILGLRKPTSGKVVLPEGITIGYLPEERGVYADATVKEHLTLFAELTGVKNIGEKIDYWLKELQIEQYKDMKLKCLSKGNGQKVQLIITLINDPELVILDEPFSGLDPVNSELFNSVIKKHCADKYLLISSHQMDRVEGLCDNVIMLNNGKAVACGAIEELKAQHGNSRVMLSYSEEAESLLKAYNPERMDDKLVVNTVDAVATCKKVLKDLAESGLAFSYLKYDRISMNDLFIKLLGE